MLLLYGVLSLFIASYGEITQQWKVIISTSTKYNFNFFWNKCAGVGHGSLNLRKDLQQYIRNVHDKIGITSVRAHGILDDDIDLVNGANDYSFINIDKIYDYLLSINMKPYINVGYMPNDFASNSNTTMHYKANISPPKDWKQWSSFIQTWTQHLLSRYDIDEISTWRFEVWNEPNCGFYVEPGCCGCNCPYFSDYMTLYLNTVKAIKAVNNRLKVGGPSTAQLCWIDEFLANVTANNIPIDFISSHLYPSDPQLNHNDGVNAFYNTLKTASNILNKYKYLNLSLDLSEFNSGLYGKNVGNHDDNYAASFMIFHASKLQSLINDGNYDRMCYFEISDVDNWNGFGSVPFHNELGMQTIRGIHKPIFSSMQLLYEFGSTIAYNTNRIDANNDDGTVQIYTLKNLNNNNDNRYTIYAANWNLNGQNISNQVVQIKLEGIGIPKIAKIYRIDANNTNPVIKWKNMGSPTYPLQSQLQILNESAQLISTTMYFSNINTNTVQFNVTLPIYGVVVIDIQY